MADLAIGVLYSARPWRAALQRYVRDHVAGVTLRLVRDSRMLQEEEVHIVVLDDETTFLTPAFVAALRERGVKVAGVFDPAEAGPEGPAMLSRLGVDATLPSTLTSRVLDHEGVLLVATHLGVGDVLSDEFLGHRIGTIAGALYRREELLGLLAAAGFGVEVERQRGPLPHEYQSQRMYLLARRNA
jgi:hypothetical protein